MDPRYMDFGEVDSSALHPTTQKELWNKRWVLIYLGCVSSLVGGRVQFGSLLLRAN